MLGTRVVSLVNREPSYYVGLGARGADVSVILGGGYDPVDGPHFGG